MKVNEKIIFISDLFANEYEGGAELTSEAVIKCSPNKIFKIKSIFADQQFIEDNKDKYFLIGNYSQLSKNSIITLIADKIKYSIIAYDYMYCRFRSSHLHKIQSGQECDCHRTQYGKFVYGFYKNAEHVFFMSQGHMNEWKRVFPTMNNWPDDKLLVQGSTFDDESIKLIEDLNTKNIEQKINDVIVKYSYDNFITEKIKYYTPKKDKFAVLQGGSWIKNQTETELYCKQNNIQYELVGGGLPHHIFLILLSQYKGLIFFPKGFDTNPRIVIESKLLGLDLILGENVQTKDEEWLKKSPSDLLHYLKTQRNFIWEKIKYEQL